MAFWLSSFYGMIAYNAMIYSCLHHSVFIRAAQIHVLQIAIEYSNTLHPPYPTGYTPGL